MHCSHRTRKWVNIVVVLRIYLATATPSIHTHPQYHNSVQNSSSPLRFKTQLLKAYSLYSNSLFPQPKLQDDVIPQTLRHILSCPHVRYFHYILISPQSNSVVTRSKCNSFTFGFLGRYDRYQFYKVCALARGAVYN